MHEVRHSRENSDFLFLDYDCWSIKVFKIQTESNNLLITGQEVAFWTFELKEGVHGSAHVHESKYFFPFARYDPSLFNLIRCL